MSRARNIKPGFFKNEVLSDMSAIVRLLFIGLWCEADREGRIEYRPRRLKAAIFPYDEVNIEDGIAQLQDNGFLLVYDVDGAQYIQISNWAKHQNPHHKEVASVIKAPPGHVDTVCMGYLPLNNAIRERIYARDGRVCRECGATHGLSIDHIIPVSRCGNSLDDNLQVLCLSCNARKGNKISSIDNAQPMHGASIDHASGKNIDSCPTDSLIPDSPSLIPDSKEKPLGQQAARNGATRFAEFWSIYPRKKGKSGALSKWRARGLDGMADQIIADVKRRIREDRQWADGYIPHGDTYVSKRVWEDEIEARENREPASNVAYLAGAL